MSDAPASSPPNPADPDREARDRALFERASASYGRKDLAPAARIARKHRLLQTLAVVPVGSDVDILEAGCGAGFSATYLRGRYRSFVGIDYAEGLIEFARRHNSGPGVEFAVSNIKDFAPGRLFDVIVMIGVLHHMDDMAAGMQQLVALLKPGGWIAANEPQSANPLIRFARAIRKRMDGDYSEEQDQLSAGQLRGLYEQAGLVNVRIRPQGLLSTPFAEVILPAQRVLWPVSAATVGIDRATEAICAPLLRTLSWNLIAAGQKPPH